MQINVPQHNTDQIAALRSLFEKQLKELYRAEILMVQALPEIIKSTTSPDLVSTLQNHAAETATHVGRIEKIFGAIGLPSQTLAYDAIDCYIKETKNLIAHSKPGVARDAGIIGVLQKIKHYEIACYGTLRAYSIALREEDVVTLLENTLDEEKQMDIKLSAIAESHINIEAADKEI